MANSKNDWKFMQCFGNKNESDPINEADVITALEFNDDGKFIATGDKGGRVVVFERNESKTSCDYQFYAEIQSHECEFDYLKSVFIDEKINKLKWCKAQNNTNYLLSTNEKNIKLWKIAKKVSKDVLENNYSYALANPNQADSFIPKLPRLKSGDAMVSTGTKHCFSNAHSYHINSLSTCSDGETFLSADDLRINVWNLHVPDSSYSKRHYRCCLVDLVDVLDIKPSQLEFITEVITAAEFHPINSHEFIYATSRGFINLIDNRKRAHISTPSLVFKPPNPPKNVFSELVNVISSLKYTKDGKYIFSRDFMSMYMWDSRSPSEPINRFPIHDYLSPRICEFFDSDLIYDRFDIALSPTGSSVMGGTYGDHFFVYDTLNQAVSPFEANRAALKKKQLSKSNLSLSSPFGRSSTSSLGSVKGLSTSASTYPSADQVKTDRKVLNLAWHPTENSIAIGATSMLYIFSQIHS